MNPCIVFSTERYRYLGDMLCAEESFEEGALVRQTFPDGERYRRIDAQVAGRDVLLLGGTVDEADTLELYDLACALVHRGVHILTLAIPWYGYQTMEREVHPGDVVVAKTRARLLSSIPTAGSGTRVVLMDLHQEGITQYFQGSVRPVHLRATPVVLELIRELAGGDEFVVGATDAGRAKWVERLANDLGVDAGFVFKRRTASGTDVTALAADVTGKTVVIYDDMIRTGGSLLGAAKAYRDAGAARIAAVTTHGVFPGDALVRLRDSGLLTRVACTDTHPRARELGAAEPDFLRVKTVAPLLAAALGPGGSATLGVVNAHQTEGEPPCDASE